MTTPCTAGGALTLGLVDEGEFDIYPCWGIVYLNKAGEALIGGSQAYNTANPCGRVATTTCAVCNREYLRTRNKSTNLSACSHSVRRERLHEQKRSM